MATYRWLLALHVTGAFLFAGGAVIAAVLWTLARGRERPSEVALLLGLARIAVVVVGVGVVATLVFGLWLVHEAGYAYGAPWIVWSLVLWASANALGAVGGRRDKETRLLAERLAAEGDAPSPELAARLRDPVSLSLNVASGAVVVGILALMIFKPGA